MAKTKKTLKKNKNEKHWKQQGHKRAQYSNKFKRTLENTWENRQEMAGFGSSWFNKKASQERHDDWTL